MPIECSTKSILPPNISMLFSIRLSKSSTRVASAGIAWQASLSANTLILESPRILNATGAFVKTSSAPSWAHCSATFQAIDLSSNAPKIIPFFPFKIIKRLVFWMNSKLMNKNKHNITKILLTNV